MLTACKQYSPAAGATQSYIAYTQNVISKPKKKDSDMKIDKTTYTDRKENQTGMPADHTSRPDKVLFFSDTHFLFFKSRPTLHTLASRTSRHTNQNLSKITILPTHESKFDRIINYLALK